MALIGHGGIPEDFNEELQDNIVFSLDPLRTCKVAKGIEDAPMWSSGSIDDMSWSFSEEE